MDMEFLRAGKFMIKRFILIPGIILAFSSALPGQGVGRDEWQQPVAIMDSIGVNEGMIIGEAGAGEGYLTFWLAKRVGKSGKIYANDISKSALNAIVKRCRRDSITNITTILGQEDDPLFPQDQLDMIVMLIAFHDFTDKVGWLNNAKKYLKPDGFLVIIERDPEKWGRDHGHFMTRAEILATLAKVNYDLVALKTFLPRDNIFIYRFSKKSEK